MSATNTGWRLLLLDAPAPSLTVEAKPITLELVSPGPQGPSGSAAAVTSVNGQHGAVVLGAADVGAAASVHGHVISDVSGLQTALDGKAATSHTHTASQISDSSAVGRSVLTAADAAAARTAISAAAASHTHPTTDITGLGALATLNSVASAQIDAGAVTTTNIGSKAVDTAQIANGAVQALQLDTNAVETAKINNKAVTLAKLQDLAGSTIIGRTAGTGTPEQIALSADFVLEDLIPGGATLSISTRSARSVIGRSAATSGAPADIAATADGQVLRRAGGVVGFGANPAAGSSGQVMYNDSGVIAGDSGFTFDPLSDTVTVGSVAFTPNGELIRNTTNGQIDFMPSPLAANAFGVYMDFTSFTVGARMGVIRSSDGAKNPAGSYIQYETQLAIVSDVNTVFGNSAECVMRLTSTGNETFQIAPSVAAGRSAAVAIVNQSHVGVANRSPATVHVDPTFYVYSSDGAQANDYVRVSHDQTDGVIEAGAGKLRLKAATLHRLEGSGGAFDLDSTPGSNGDVLTFNGGVVSLQPPTGGGGGVSEAFAIAMAVAL